MRWILPMGLVFVIASRAGWGAQTPSDLHFRLRLTEGKTRYSTSEPIAFEVSLWSDAPRGRYYASWFDLVPHTAIELKLEPGTGTVNLLELELGSAGSILGSMGYLTASPVVEAGNLTEWYRFESPGHFSICDRGRLGLGGRRGQATDTDSSRIEFCGIRRVPAQSSDEEAPGSFGFE